MLKHQDLVASCISVLRAVTPGASCALPQQSDGVLALAHHKQSALFTGEHFDFIRRDQTWSEHCSRRPTAKSERVTAYGEGKRSGVTIHLHVVIGTFCKPKFGNFDGNGPRPGERCETKWRIFANPIPTFGSRALEPNKIFGSVQPGRFECASAVWDCRTPHQLLLFLSLLQLCHQFRDRRALQRQFRLLQLQYVLQLRSPGYYETIDLSLGGCRDSWESLKKCILFVESKGWRGEGKRRRKTTSRIIKLRKGSLPSPLSPSHSPFASTLPHVKQFCCCLVDYQSRPHCLAKQAKVKSDVLPRQDHFVTLWLESNRVSAKIFLKVPSRFAIGTGRTENETENQFSVCRTNFRFANVRVYFDPARSKPFISFHCIYFTRIAEK